MSPLRSISHQAWLLSVSLLLTFAPPEAHAERADRLAPIEGSATGRISGDLRLGSTTLEGGVVLRQGTAVLKSNRAELRQSSDGYYQGIVFGSADHPVSFRQVLDGPSRSIAAEALQMSFDGKSDVLTLSRDVSVRLLRGEALVQEISGRQVVYERSTERFDAWGSGGSLSGPFERVRTTLYPAHADLSESCVPFASPALRSSTAISPIPER